MSCRVGKLLQEHTLRPVSLPERMGCIEFRQHVGGSFGELLAGQAMQIIGLAQLCPDVVNARAICAPVP